jgi:aminomethyltransferase
MNAPLFISPVRVLEPGLNTLPPDTERYVVRAGGITALELFGGDRIEVVNPEGMQLGEITVFDARGNSDMRLIGAQADGKAKGFKTILGGNDASAIKLARTLKFRGISLDSAHSTSIFSKKSRAGDSISFTANEAVTCIVAAPGEPMLVDQQNTITDLTIFVHRQALDSAERRIHLPDPLADPLQDQRIEARTAFAYEVKAGQYIQLRALHRRHQYASCGGQVLPGTGTTGKILYPGFRTPGGTDP